jgi:hypothetical protein
MDYMTNQTKSSGVEPKSLLTKAPLMYLNYPKKYRQHAYNYLLGQEELIEYIPEFDDYTLKVLESHKGSVTTLLRESKKHGATKTARKLREIALIKAYHKMYQTGDAKDFQQVVGTIWGMPQKELYFKLLDEALAHASQNSRDDTILKEAKKLLNWREIASGGQTTFVHVSPKLFKETKNVFKQAYADETEILRDLVARKPFIHRYNSDEITELLQALVDYYGLNKQGWQITLSNKTERLMVNYDSKTISVARGSFRLSRPRAIGLVLHEIGVHANARKSIVRNAKQIGERRVIEEGLGIFAEQMMFTRFQPVRSLRYIALGLALGLDGKPREAKEVYEIIWRLRYLGGIAKNKKFAREYAAKEVSRVFRGMPLNQKGIVITKDRAYVEGNQLIWANIRNNGPQFTFEKLLGKKL